MTTIDGTPQLPEGIRTNIETTKGKRELALLVCGGVWRFKKELGVQAAPLAEVARRLRRQPTQVEEGANFAVQQGWMSRGDDGLSLTATGIYLAKQTLNLPR